MREIYPLGGVLVGQEVHPAAALHVQEVQAADGGHGNWRLARGRRLRPRLVGLRSVVNLFGLSEHIDCILFLNFLKIF